MNGFKFVTVGHDGFISDSVCLLFQLQDQLSIDFIVLGDFQMDWDWSSQCWL